MNILSGTITSSTRYLLRRCINTTRKLKHLAKYELRKQLAETLIFFKTRLCRSSLLLSTTILTATFATSSICCRKFCFRPQC